MFETESTLGREFYKILFEAIDSGWKVRLHFLNLYVICILACIVPFHFFPHGILIWGIFAVWLFIYALRRVKQRPAKFADTFISNTKEETGSDTISYITQLSDEGICYKNLVTHAEGVIKYSLVKEVYYIKGFYYLLFKSNRGLPVNANRLDEKQRAECVEYLNSKLSGVKWFQCE